MKAVSRLLMLPIVLGMLAWSSLSLAEQELVATPGYNEAVNINTADTATLANSLEGIGPTKAAAIVAYRENYGEFQSIDELEEVPGIGQRTIEQNRDRIVLQ